MALKLRVLTKFPARVLASTGLLVEVENGEYTFSLDMGSLEQIDSVSDQEASFIPVVTPGLTDDDADVNQIVSIAGLLDLILFANDALHELGAGSSTGFWTITGPGEGSARTFQASTGLLWTNPAGQAGNPSINYDFQNLTLDPSPNASNDFLVSYDASAAAFKKVTIGSVGSAGSVSDVGGATGSISVGSGLQIAGNVLSAIIKGHLFGLTLANNGSDATNDIDISAGEAASDASSPQLMILASALTKRLDANWAAGTNQGMRNSAAAITDTTYHIYLVSKAAGADVDVYAHTSAVVATVITALQAESGGASYVSARRVGSIIRASSAIVAFSQRGNRFLLSVPQIQNTSALGTSATLFTLRVPTGIQVDAMCNFTGGHATTATAILITSPDQADTSAATSFTFYGSADATSFLGYSSGQYRTDTSGRIRARSDTASSSLNITCEGWIDAAIPTS